MLNIVTGIEGFTLRYAERKDTAVILAFIKELAVYENEIDQVTATEEVLGRSLFDQKKAEVILGEYEGKVVGFALFHYDFSTFLGQHGLHLVDLYIEPEMRGKGFGRTILAYLAKLAVEQDCGRFEWWVHDWNEPAIKFYKDIGAFPLELLRIYRLCAEPLRNFASEQSFK